MFVNFNILNQLGSPAINSNTFANRPAAGQTGRLFVSTDTFEIYRDNGTTWDLIGGPGSSTITGTGTATQVAYFTSSQAIGSSANLYWDNTSGFLGVGTAAPTTRIEAVKTDGIGIYSNYTTNAGSGSSATAIWAKNVTNSSGYGAVIEETTPNATAGQYPLLIKHSLSSGTAGVGMGTGVHWQLPDDAGTFKTTQLTVETINAAAATYATRYRFNVQSNGSSTPVAYINATGLGIFTATPSSALDIHSTGIMAQLNSTSATANSLLAFQRSGSGLWRIGDQYNGGNNFFELHNTVLTNNAIQVLASSNEATFSSTKTYSTGNAIGVAVQHNLTIPNAVNVGLAAIGGVNSNLNLTLGGSTTVAATGRQGLEGSTTIRFTGAGTLTMTQASTIRAFSALSSVYAFNGSAVGTITHLAGLRICFPDNVGSAVNITNNYALLINNQTTGTGTVTYTNRWGIYQEGASDLNYMAANLLLGSTVNTGDKLQVTGTTYLSSQLTVGNTLYVDTVFDRVGIGTILPAVKLDVIGDIHTTSKLVWGTATNGTTGQIATDNTNNYLDYLGALIFRTAAASSEKMRITSAGLVGINTNSPNELLSLGFADNASNSIEFRSTTYARLALITGGNNASSSNGYLAFSTRNGGSINEVMRLTTNSRVGIGTNAPNSIFEIKNTGTGTKSIAAAFRDSSADGNGLEIYNENGLSSIYSTYYTGAGSNQDLGFYTTTSSGAQNQVMRLTSTQRVGIGTGAPALLLELNSSSTAALPATSGSTQSTGGRLRLTTTGASTAVIDYGTAGGSGGWVQATNKSDLSTNYAYSINPNGGNVLIGTTTDAGQKLQVNGGNILNSFANASHNFKATGQITITASGGTQTIDTSTNCGIVIISENTSGKCGVFFYDYASGTTILIADPSSNYATSVTASKVSLTKSANTNTLTITNNTTNFNFTVFSMGASD